MSERQGLVLLWLHHDSLVMATLDGVEGSDRDDKGIWHGLSEINPASYRRLDRWADDPRAFADFLRAGLLASRYVIPVPPIWRTEGVGADQAEQDQRLASAFGRETPKGLFVGMKSCVVLRALSEVRFVAKRRRRGGDFQGFPPVLSNGHEDVVLNWDALSQQWLAGAILCFSRCL